MQAGLFLHLALVAVALVRTAVIGQGEPFDPDEDYERREQHRNELPGDELHRGKQPDETQDDQDDAASAAAEPPAEPAFFIHHIFKMIKNKDLKIRVSLSSLSPISWLLRYHYTTGREYCQGRG